MEFKDGKATRARRGSPAFQSHFRVPLAVPGNNGRHDQIDLEIHPCQLNQYFAMPRIAPSPHIQQADSINATRRDPLTAPHKTKIPHLAYRAERRSPPPIAARSHLVLEAPWKEYAYPPLPRRSPCFHAMGSSHVGSGTQPFGFVSSSVNGWYMPAVGDTGKRSRVRLSSSTLVWVSPQDL